MFGILHAAGAGPVGCEFLARTGFAVLLIDIVLLVGVLAQAPEVLGAVDGKVEEVPTFAGGLSALDLAIGGFVVLVQVIAEAFSGGAYHFAL